MTEKTLWRVPKLPREEWTDAAREVFSFWGEPNSWEEGSRTNIMMVMAQHPDLGKAYNTFGKQKQIQVKEVKFRPGTEEGDYQVKLRNLIRFLTEGDKAKVTLRFRGREMARVSRKRSTAGRITDPCGGISMG